MEYRVEASNRKTQKFLHSLMPSIVVQLGLANSKKAVLVKVTKDVPENMEGAALHIELADCFLVLVKPPIRNTAKGYIELATNLAHEMVHVRQLAKGMLKFLPNNNKMWMGKKYGKNTPYLNCPWEIDAFSKQEIIVRKALEI